MENNHTNNNNNNIVVLSPFHISELKSSGEMLSIQLSSYSTVSSSMSDTQRVSEAAAALCLLQQLVVSVQKAIEIHINNNNNNNSENENEIIIRSSDELAKKSLSVTRAAMEFAVAARDGAEDLILDSVSNLCMHIANIVEAGEILFANVPKPNENNIDALDELLKLDDSVVKANQQQLDTWINKLNEKPDLRPLRRSSFLPPPSLMGSQQQQRTLLEEMAMKSGTGNSISNDGNGGDDDDNDNNNNNNGGGDDDDDDDDDDDEDEDDEDYEYQPPPEPVIPSADANIKTESQNQNQVDSLPNVHVVTASTSTTLPPPFVLRTVHDKFKAEEPPKGRERTSSLGYMDFSKVLEMKSSSSPRSSVNLLAKATAQAFQTQVQQNQQTQQIQQTQAQAQTQTTNSPQQNYDLPPSFSADDFSLNDDDDDDDYIPPPDEEFPDDQQQNSTKVLESMQLMSVKETDDDDSQQQQQQQQQQSTTTTTTTTTTDAIVDPSSTSSAVLPPSVPARRIFTSTDNNNNNNNNNDNNAAATATTTDNVIAPTPFVSFTATTATSATSATATTEQSPEPTGFDAYKNTFLYNNLIVPQLESLIEEVKLLFEHVYQLWEMVSNVSDVNPIKIIPLVQKTEYRLYLYAEKASESLAFVNKQRVRWQIYYAAIRLRNTVIQFLSAVKFLLNSNRIGISSLREQLESTSLLLLKDAVVKLIEASSLSASLKYGSGPIASSGAIAEIIQDINFYDEPKDAPDENIVFGTAIIEGVYKEINAGTLNKLIERLTHERITDTTFQKAFLTTYQAFTTPTTLLTKLCERYSVPRKKLPKHISYDDWRKTSVVPIQLKVCAILRLWLETRFDDFDSAIILQLNNFIRDQLEKDGHVLLAKQLRSIIEKKLQELYGSSGSNADGIFQFVPPPQASMVPVTGLLPLHLINSVPLDELARQMTLVDFKLFSQIQPVELLNTAWNKSKLRWRAPNVMAIINRFNETSAWVASLIVWQESWRDRKKTMNNLIKLATEMRKLNNFNCLASINAGMALSAVHRLRFTREAVKPELKSVHSELEALLDPAGSYRAYREAMEKVNPPCVPFLGVYLRDLVFLEDGNLDVVNGCLVNFEKHRLVYNVLGSLQQFQQTQYSFQVMEPAATFISPLPKVGEDEQQRCSLLREPREISRDELMAKEKALQASINSALAAASTSSSSSSSLSSGIVGVNVRDRGGSVLQSKSNRSSQRKSTDLTTLNLNNNNNNSNNNNSNGNNSNGNNTPLGGLALYSQSSPSLLQSASPSSVASTSGLSPSLLSLSNNNNNNNSSGISLAHIANHSSPRETNNSVRQRQNSGTDGSPTSDSNNSSNNTNNNNNANNANSGSTPPAEKAASSSFRGGSIRGLFSRSGNLPKSSSTAAATSTSTTPQTTLQTLSGASPSNNNGDLAITAVTSSAGSNSQLTSNAFDTVSSTGSVGDNSSNDSSSGIGSASTRKKSIKEKSSDANSSVKRMSSNMMFTPL